MVDGQRRLARPRNGAKAESGTIVSLAVLTAAPAEALLLPTLASALVEALRAESFAEPSPSWRAEPARAFAALATVPDGRLLVRRAARIAARGADIDILQDRGVLPIARRDLHHDVILVDRAVDRRDLALAEGVVERIVDLARRQAETRGGVAIDHDIRLQASLLLVGTDVGERRSCRCNASTSFGVKA